MIQFKRTRNTQPDTKRKTSFKTEKAMVNDYFNSGLNITGLAQKYGKTKAQISALLTYWEPCKTSKKPEPIKSTKDNLVLIDSKDYEFALFLLAEYGINFREPGNFKYEEKFNSSI